MLFILLGPDEFTKREFVTQQAAKTGAVASFFYDEDTLPSMPSLSGQDLFSKALASAFVGCIGKMGLEKHGELLKKSKNLVFILEEKLDKRSAFNKQLLADKEITVKDFALPHGKELDRWLIARAKALGGSLSAAAADALAQALGRDDAVETKFGGKVVEVKELYTLFQADGELKKLLAYADGREVEPDDIAALVRRDAEVDVFSIVNALGENRKAEALRLIDTFLEAENAADEKGKIIQLNALLSDQFRNLLLVRQFAERTASDAEILEKTSWKSGRLFVLRKLAARFPDAKLQEILSKFEHLDLELKTSSTPPKALLDLIVAQF